MESLRAQAQKISSLAHEIQVVTKQKDQIPEENHPLTEVQRGNVGTLVSAKHKLLAKISL
jgi:hypothetical protein